MSDDTPTQRFDQQGPATAGTNAVPEEQRRRSLVPILIVIGAVLVIAVGVLLFLLLSRGNGSPQALVDNTGAPTNSADSSSTPVPVPTVTVTVTPTQTNGPVAPPERPNGHNVLLQKYTISPMVVDCSAGAPAGSDNLHISWTTLNGQAIFFGVNTIDAQAGGMGWMNLPLTGTQHNFPAGYDPFKYPCGSASQQYTFTAIGQASKQSLTITVHRK